MKRQDTHWKKELSNMNLTKDLYPGYLSLSPSIHVYIHPPSIHVSYNSIIRQTATIKKKCTGAFSWTKIDGIGMTNKHITTLFIRETQTKTSIRYHYTFTKIKKTSNIKCW